MRHLLLAAPLALLLAACADPCTAPVLTVSWQFDLASGVHDAACTDAGVGQLDLWVDGVRAGSGIACAQGSATFPGVAAGTHEVLVQGYTAAGLLVDRDRRSVTVGACGETRATVRPGQGDVRLAYDTPGHICHAVGATEAENGYMWYSLTDVTTGAVFSTINLGSSDADKARFPCGAFPVIRVPYGTYQLNWIQVVGTPLAANPVPIYQYCSPLPATVVAAGVTQLPVQLIAANGSGCAPAP